MSMGMLIDDYASGKNTTPLPPGLDQLDWLTKIQDLLPEEWQLHDEQSSSKANLVDILSHVTGLPRYVYCKLQFDGNAGSPLAHRHDASYTPVDTTEDIMRRLPYLRPRYELREKWAYSNQVSIITKEQSTRLT